MIHLTRDYCQEAKTIHMKNSIASAEQTEKTLQLINIACRYWLRIFTAAIGSSENLDTSILN